jgi:DNA topoisomerase VI subunit B
MTNSSKVTYRSAVEYAIANLVDAPAEVNEKLKALAESLAKKASGDRKPTAKQKENVGFKADILAFMESGVQYTIGELAKSVPSIASCGMSANRVSALVKQLKDNGDVVRTEVKGKAYFALAE